jgi:tetratricopeptide (TPR) repeat protein
MIRRSSGGAGVIAAAWRAQAAGRDRLRASGVIVSHRVFDIARLPITDALLVGRDDELARLDAAWQAEHIGVVTVVGRGGEGKTALVNAWLAELGERGWLEGKHVYGWTFYSQGTTGAGGASADLFFEHALKTFGHAGPPIKSPAERGEVLAKLLAAQPTLLIIDGLEPMQHGPGPTQGRLLDPGLRTLLRHLAVHNPGGLCVLTTREPVADIAAYAGRTVDLLELTALSSEAGMELLRKLGARGSDKELRAAAEDMDGHALAITLLGTYVRTALQGDIQRRQEVALLRERRQGEHARRVMRSYEAWFGAGPERAVLRLMGLFDRAATGAEIRALRAAPAIVGLTDALVGLSEHEWQIALTALRDARLLAEADKYDPDGLDAHPLVREYAAERLQQEQPEAWRQGHERLYRYFCAAAPEQPDTMREMRPLFWAVAHGCAAGRHQEVFYQVLRGRIDRWAEHFAAYKLGAFGAELGAIARLFDQPFVQLAAELDESTQAWLLGNAGFCLRALGRLCEARAPMQAGLDALLAREDWQNAAQAAGNLAALHQSLGELARAEDLARTSQQLAEQSGDAFMRIGRRTTLAEVLLQRGHVHAAGDLFAHAEAMQENLDPGHPLLYSLRGYRYCDLLLERRPAGMTQVRERASQALALAEQQGFLLDIALGHLTLGRAWLLEAEHMGTDAAAWTQARTELNKAVHGLREAGHEEFISRGLSARAAWHRARLAHADAPGPDASLADAERDLDEAEEIAEYGAMRLHLTDIALERARLALVKERPAGARAHLDRARELIEATGYHRRDRDLAELEARIAAAESAAVKAKLAEAEAAKAQAAEAKAALDTMPAIDIDSIDSDAGPDSTPEPSMISQPIPSHLADELRAGRVIPFAGAGVSLAVLESGPKHQRLFPSWTELLLRGAKNIEADDAAGANVIRALLEDHEPDYLGAARRLRDAMSGAIWPEFLKAQLDPSSSRADHDSLALARAVWNLGSRLIITTNYDRVLDWACPDHHDLRRYDNNAVAELAQLLREPAPRPTVWHLHGRIDNVDQMVLTSDSYHALYGSRVDESRYQAALATLHTHLAGRTILFIGFSLNDPFVTDQLSGVFKRFQGYAGTAYALIHQGEMERLRALIKRDALPVKVVPFQDFGQPLLDLVRALGEQARGTTPRVEP